MKIIKYALFACMGFWAGGYMSDKEHQQVVSDLIDSHNTIIDQEDVKLKSLESRYLTDINVIKSTCLTSGLFKIDQNVFMCVDIRTLEDLDLNNNTTEKSFKYRL